ncbi:MAG: dinuclear metal center YbgI/SA1388 family protein [Flavobacteriales bacterium]|jgi:dinuclear metal center YbgI/SA1388 family protein
MKIKEVISYLDSIAPPQLQESYDNSGLIVGDSDKEITGVLISLDCLEAVVDEAIALGYNLVVAHHPIVFGGLKRFTGKNYIERTVIKAIKNDIALYAIHTNLDNMSDGVNHEIGKRLGMKSMSILRPMSGILEKLAVFIPETHAEKLRLSLFDAGAGAIGNYSQCSFNSSGTGTFTPNEVANPVIGERGKHENVKEVKVEVVFPQWKRGKVLSAMNANHPYEVVAHDILVLANQNEEFGAGMLGELEKEMAIEDFAALVKENMQLELIKSTKFVKSSVRRVAWCGGSGSFLLEDAIRAKADVFISADFKYHQYFDADEHILIFDIGHYESEQFTSDLLSVRLKEKFANFAVRLSEIKTNPIKFI